MKHKGLLSLGCAAALCLSGCGAVPSGIVEIVQDGRVLRRVDLAAVTKEETMTVRSGESVNTIRIAPGEIRMVSANCPDQICVRAGRLEKDGLPIVCLPHRLVIQWAE